MRIQAALEFLGKALDGPGWKGGKNGTIIALERALSSAAFEIQVRRVKGQSSPFEREWTETVDECAEALADRLGGDKQEIIDIAMAKAKTKAEKW